jgi:hypothetical protein
MVCFVRKAFTAALIVLSLAGCGPRRTVDEAVQLYRDNRETFQSLAAMALHHKALKQVSPLYDPKADAALIDKYGDFDEGTIVAYNEIAANLRELDVFSLFVYRSADAGHPGSIVDFTVSNTGSAVTDGDSIALKYLSASADVQTFTSQPSECIQIEPQWFVCRCCSGRS